MASGVSIRARRRTAAQQLALLQVKREISATDPHGRLKYIRDFSEAFRDYGHTLTDWEFKQHYSSADILLVGDYHALAACQEFAAALLSQLAQSERPVVLALEMVFSRDQYVLDQWLRGEISDDELRNALRYEDEWGYDWEPFAHLLRQARKHGCQIYGIDLKPRGNMRKIALRDRHAAAQIAQIRRAHPEAHVLTLFGEAHLAPNHLPKWLRLLRPRDRVLTILQNLDEIYWKAAGELSDNVHGVEVSEDVLCVFNATPLEKYESYRIYIGKWRTEPSQPDLAPTFYNLVDTFLRCMGLEQYPPATGSHPSALIENYPEVYLRSGEKDFSRLLARKQIPAAERVSVLQKLKQQGCAYFPKHNMLLIKRFQLAHAAEEAVRFVQYECRGATCSNGPWAGSSQQDHFYFDVIDRAFTTFGTRMLLPHYPVTRRDDFRAPVPFGNEQSVFSVREYREMVEFLVLHKEEEGQARLRAELPRVIATGISSSGKKREFLVRHLGGMLGAEMHEAYVSGLLNKRYLRSLFFRKVHLPGMARKTYFELAQKVNPVQAKLFN
jgi:hypothetical protein